MLFFVPMYLGLVLINVGSAVSAGGVERLWFAVAPLVLLAPALGGSADGRHSRRVHGLMSPSTR